MLCKHAMFGQSDFVFVMLFPRSDEFAGLYLQCCIPRCINANSIAVGEIGFPQHELSVFEAGELFCVCSKDKKSTHSWTNYVWIPLAA